MSDHVEIECSVRYRGIWSPVFICADHLPGTTINQTSSDHVLYTRLIAASNIEDSTQLNCSMSFTLITDYRANFPDILTKLEKPVYDFVWKTSAIRIVDDTSKYCTSMRLPFVIMHATFFFLNNNIGLSPHISSASVVWGIEVFGVQCLSVLIIYQELPSTRPHQIMSSTHVSLPHQTLKIPVHWTHCTMSFTLITNYQSISPSIPTEPAKPVYHFSWNTSPIHIVNDMGK